MNVINLYVIIKDDKCKPFHYFYNKDMSPRDSIEKENLIWIEERYSGAKYYFTRYHEIDENLDLLLKDLVVDNS